MDSYQLSAFVDEIEKIAVSAQQMRQMFRTASKKGLSPRRQEKILKYLLERESRLLYGPFADRKTYPSFKIEHLPLPTFTATPSARTAPHVTTIPGPIPFLQRTQV